MKIGAKIYYDKENGNVLQEVGERSDNVVETTTEQDYSTYAALAEWLPDSVGMLQLE